MAKTKIYTFVNGVMPNGDVKSCALREDGKLLAERLSSNMFYMDFDIGNNSIQCHDIYKAECPDGYEIEFVKDPTRHHGLLTALHKNRDYYKQ